MARVWPPDFVIANLQAGNGTALPGDPQVGDSLFTVDIQADLGDDSADELFAFTGGGRRGVEDGPDALICDEDGLYDPSDFNDRLLLGLKGTMSEAELHFIRARLVGGQLSKARRGEPQMSLPVGLVYHGAGNVVLDPTPVSRTPSGTSSPCSPAPASPPGRGTAARRRRWRGVRR